MDHRIKINRACRIAQFVPSASAEIQASIPAALIAGLTAKQLGLVRLALNGHWHKAIAHAEAEIVGNGYVWSRRHGKLLDVQLPRRD